MDLFWPFQTFTGDIFRFSLRHTVCIILRIFESFLSFMLNFKPSWTIPALRYSFSRCGEEVIARCPELGIAAAGATQGDALKNLDALVLYQLNQW